MDGDSYRWANSLFGHVFWGDGVGGDLWFLVGQTAIGIAIVWLGTRPRPGALFVGLLSGWSALLLGSSVYQALTTTEDIRFRGDTLGIDVSIKWVAPISYVVLFGLVLTWLALRAGSERSITEERESRPGFLILLLALLPIQFLLLRFGAPHGTTDQIGVIVTILQWVFLPWALWRQAVPGSFEAGATADRSSPLYTRDNKGAKP